MSKMKVVYKIICIFILSVFLITGCDENKDEKKGIDINLVSVESIPDQQYDNGNKITPPVSVKYDNIELEEGKDYVVIYRNNIDVGTATVIIVSKNDKFKGQKNVKFNIVDDNKIALSEVKISGVEKTYRYNGSQIKPVPVLTYNDITLVEGIDYELDYGENTQVGNAHINITGIGKYEGSLSMLFRIIETVKKPIIKCYGTFYSTEVQTIAKCQYGKISNEKQKDVGTYTVKCTSEEDPTIVETESCSIDPANINLVDVKYTGEKYVRRENDGPISPNPEPTLIYKGKTLTKGIDYNITYYGESDIGAVTAVINGKGNFTGYKSESLFYIYSKDCGKSGKSMVTSVILEGKEKSDMDSLFGYDEKQRIKIFVEEGETVSIRVIVPAVCSPIDKLIKQSSGGISGFSEIVEQSVESDKKNSDGTIEYIWNIKGKKIGATVITQYRNYSVESDQLGGINFSAYANVTVVQAGNKPTPMPTAKPVKSCCCKYPADAKVSDRSCYWSDFVCEDHGTYTASSKLCDKPEVTATPKPSSKVTYTCTLTYVDKTKQLVINGYASNGASISSTYINGEKTSYIVIASEGTHSGVVHFSDGGTAKCSKTLAKYTCTMKYNSNTNKITISGSASNGTSVTIKEINGVRVSSSITPTAGVTKYSGNVTFADGRKAKCSITIKSKPTVKPTIKPTATPTPAGICCCTKDKSSCSWLKSCTSSKPISVSGATSKNCSSNAVKPTATPAKKCCCATNYGKDCRVQTTCTGYRSYSYGYSLSECSNH